MAFKTAAAAAAAAQLLIKQDQRESAWFFTLEKEGKLNNNVSSDTGDRIADALLEKLYDIKEEKKTSEDVLSKLPDEYIDKYGCPPEWLEPELINRYYYIIPNCFIHVLI